MSETTSGIDLIAAERRRQVEQEGWTPEHDDEHAAGEIARAAACYAVPPECRDLIGEVPENGWPPDDWPWGWEWWKPSPKDRVRELVKAGALIAAEIDRLQRVRSPLPDTERSESLSRRPGGADEGGG